MLEIKPDLQEAQPVCSTTESSLQPPPEALTHSEQYPTISLLRVHKECLRVSSPQLLKLCMETHEIVYLAGKKMATVKSLKKYYNLKLTQNSMSMYTLTATAFPPTHLPCVSCAFVTNTTNKCCLQDHSSDSR